MYAQRYDDSFDKYNNRFFEDNEISLFFDDNENLFLKSIDSLKEEITEKKEILENGDIYKDFRIPDKQSQANKFEEKNANQNCKLPIPEKDKNNSINLTISDKLILPNDKIDEKEIKSFLSNKTNLINENANNTKNIKSNTKKAKNIDETTNKTKTINENNKYNYCNIQRKIKHFIICSLINFINNKIKEFYNGNIGRGVFKKELQTLNQKDKSESNIKFNQAFINRTIKNIFSNDISGRFTNISKDYNKIIIENLINEKNVVIKDYFTNLFSLTFFQCLEHYRGTHFYDVLNGMKLFVEEKIMDEQCAKNVEYHLYKYEEIIFKKKSRKTKNKDKKLKVKI